MSDLGALRHACFKNHLSQELERFIADWPAQDRDSNEQLPPPPSVLNWISDLPDFACRSTSGTAAEFVRSATSLHWRQSYSESDFGTGFVERYGYVEVVGKRSGLFTEKMAAGLLMFGPDTQYPSHMHPAEEIYLPIAGTAAYMTAGGGWKNAQPGAVIHNPPNTWHGIRTAREPVLIAWVWLGGDPATKSEVRP